MAGTEGGKLSGDEGPELRRGQVTEGGPGGVRCSHRKI